MGSNSIRILKGHLEDNLEIAKKLHLAEGKAFTP
jgi:hypothetical protein